MDSEEPRSPFGLSRPEYLSRMHEQLEELVADRDQMGQLLEVAIEIGSDLDLDATLHRIVDAAVKMTGATYGAIGVWAPDDTLSSFVHSGIDAATVQQIGHLPVGKGVLGVLRDRAEPLRLTDLTQHRDAVGFPEHHPPMRAFLGMPIAVRGSVYGALYITDDVAQAEFSGADEVTVRALASAASVAIDNARLLAEARARARWTDASRSIMAAVLSEHTDEEPLRLIAGSAMELTDAEQGIVLIPVEPNDGGLEVDHLVVSAAVGRYADDVLGQLIPVDGSTSGGVFTSGQPVITESFRRPIQSFTDVGERPAIVMPLRSDDETLGVIAVARNPAQPPFDTSYLALVSDFATHATFALRMAAARDRTQQVSLFEDRERIARDMHDVVIQRIFAVGLDLQGVVGRVHNRDVSGRIARCIDELQAVIDEMRMAIFNLAHAGDKHTTFSHRVQEAIARLTENQTITTTIKMTGPINVVTGDLADDAEAVVAEAISNAVRHSNGTAITIEISVEDALTLHISDDGDGIPATNDRKSGLSNMIERARNHGGDCSITSPGDGGTQVAWRVPLVVSAD